MYWLVLGLVYIIYYILYIVNRLLNYTLFLMDSCYTILNLKAEETAGMDHYKTLKDHVYDYISNQILEGQLSIKEKIKY